MGSPARPDAAPTRRTRAWWWLGGLVLVVAVAVGWLAVSAVTARHQVQRIQAQLGPLRTALQAGDGATADRLITQIRSEAAAARSDSRGPVWWLAANLPWVGRPLEVVRGGSAALHDLADGALPAVATAADTLGGDRVRHGHTVVLSRLSAAAPPLRRAAGALDVARRRVDALPRATWLGAATSSRDALVHDVDTLAAGVSDLAQAVVHLPPLLGADGERRYFVVFENDAESRGLGGLPGAFAVLTADHGRIRFTRFGSDVSLGGPVARDVTLPPGAANLYDRSFAITAQFANATLSPDFPTDAQVMRSMAEAALGQRFDGVIATDPTALSYVLAVTGPVTAPGGVRLTATNLVSELEQKEYAQFSSTTARKTFLVGAARAASHGMLAGAGSTLGLAEALRRAVDERRLVVWSNDAQQQEWLRTTRLGGTIPTTSRPFNSVVVDNAQGSKLDYYLQRSVTYRRASCAAGETETTADLTNDVPAGPLPEYVTQHSRTPQQPVGYNDDYVFLYATTGSTISSVTVDGKPVQFTTGVEAGHPVAVIELGMQPRQTYAVSVYAHEPAADGSLVRLVQPLVRPERDRYVGPDCT